MFFAVCPSCNTLNPDPAGIRPQSPFQEFILENMNFAAPEPVPEQVPEITQQQNAAVASVSLENAPDWMGAVVEPSAPISSPDIVPEPVPDTVPEMVPELEPVVAESVAPEPVPKTKPETGASWFQMFGMGN